MSKFNLYNYTGNDMMRVALTGVYHDKGYKVATDAIVLAAVKADYPEDLEHHILDKEGKDIPTRYPKWECCIPDGEGYEPYSIDAQEFKSFIRERRESWKRDTGHGTRWQGAWAVKVGPAYFKAEKFDKFLKGMKEIGATEILVKDGRRTAYAKTDKGTMLIFPILYGRPEDDGDTAVLS